MESKIERECIANNARRLSRLTRRPSFVSGSSASKSITVIRVRWSWVWTIGLIGILSAPVQSNSYENNLSVDRYWYPRSESETLLNYTHRPTSDEELHAGVGTGDLAVDEGDVSAYYLSAGYLGKHLGADISFWGNSTVLTTHEASVTIRHAFDTWDFELTPGYRLINLYGTDQAPNSDLELRARHDIDDAWLTGRVFLYQGEHWSHRFQGTYHKYSQDLTNLNVERFLAGLERLRQAGQPLSDALRFRILAVAALLQRFADPLSVMTSFEHWRLGYRAGYALERWQLSAEISASESAVTEDVHEYIALDADVVLGAWLLRCGYSVDLRDADEWAVTTGIQFSY